MLAESNFNLSGSICRPSVSLPIRCWQHLELIDAFDAFVNKRIKLNQINTLYKRKRRRINIRDKMRNILHFVKKNPKKKAEIRSFMKDKNNKYELAVTFSSVLELEKAKKIAADQDENFAPIYVYGKEERG